MKRFDDEDLVAHYLHELPPRKADVLERALQTDPTLAARYEAYATMLRAFKAGAATDILPRLRNELSSESGALDVEFFKLVD